jgi:uncharacterized protein
MELKTVKIEKPKDINVILGQSHFIKTVEDIYEAVVNASPSIKFGLAFCEASGDRLIRADGNDKEMTELAKKNALNIGAGHSFIVFLKEGYPVNVLRAINQTPEVCNIFCATSNDVEVVICETTLGRGILGVVDGEKPVGIEKEEDVKERKEFLRKIGYKR